MEQETSALPHHTLPVGTVISVPVVEREFLRMSPDTGTDSFVVIVPVMGWVPGKFEMETFPDTG